MVPAGPDHALTTAFATEAYTPSPGLLISVSVPPISVSVPNQLGSASVRGLETPSTVSNHALLAIVVANY